MARAMAKAPATGRRLPLSDSSPAHTNGARAWAGSSPLAASRPNAMGRSNRPESLGRSAGAKFTVMRWLLG